MIALHAAFFEGRLQLWSEPGLGKSALLRTLAPAGPALKPAKRSLTKAVVWLPSRNGRPVPSSPLLASEPAVNEGLRLAPFSVSTVPLDAPPAVEFLAEIFGKRVIAPAVFPGTDLAYWAAALRFAAGLVMRGQYLPALEAVEGETEARWSPLFAGNEISRFIELSKAMPPAARSMVAAKSAVPPDTPAETVLRSFCGFVVDHLVRSHARPLLPDRIESVHDCWCEALAFESGWLPGGEPEVKALREQVRQWQRPVHLSSSAPFRLCFRLEEPQQPDGAWRVAYLLQDAKDPSLVLPTAQAWDPKASVLKAFHRTAGSIREFLLLSLGQASGICPRVEASLKEKAPGGYQTDTAGAYEFLLHRAPLLEQSGFGVMLPAWWTRRGSQARLSARANVRSGVSGSGGLSLEELVRFDWELALGGERISRAELEALARLKAPLVKVRGQWVEVNQAEIRSVLEFLKKKQAGVITAREVIRMSLGLDESGVPLEFDGVTAGGWLKSALDQLHGRAVLEDLDQPAGMGGELRPYQKRGYSWLDFLRRLGFGACLADDMGLGKTIQTLALLQSQWTAGDRRPALLVCPMSVVGNWQREAQRFTPELPVLVHHGVDRKRGAEFVAEAARHAIVLSSYALLHRDETMLRNVEWGAVILDEAQNIKNPETKQARAACGLPGACRIALTGTPVENNVGDLWSLMEFLNPGFLGGQGTFRERFFLPIQVYGDQNAAGRLRRITAPFILRRLKTDKSIISDLPEKNEMKVFCNLTREQASLYQAVAKDAQKAIESAEGIERKGVVLATLTKLKQVCNHPAQFLRDNSALAGRSGKLARLLEMIEETLEAGDSSLIFSQFAEMGAMLQRHLQESLGVETLFLHGKTPKKRRDEMVERFAREDGPPIFLLSLKAGGTGLNLVRASHVFHYDRWWNPAVENQATDRAFRIGQTRNVQVHKYVCAGTLEEKIDEMIGRKKDIAGRVVGTGEGWLTELSNDQLRDLFALREDAVGE